MKRSATILFGLFLAVSVLAGAALAGGVPATVVSVARDRVVLRFEKGGGAAFPVGMRDVLVRSGGVEQAGVRVMRTSPDEVTFAVIKGKVSGLAVGSVVEVEQSRVSEGVDGC